MREPKDVVDAEISEMLGFYRDAAMRADQQQTAGSTSEQPEETVYVPARSQRPPLCELRINVGRADRGIRRLAYRIDGRHQAR